MNERLAQHYGIPGVAGKEFRKVSLADARRGILGEGSILVETSLANRTPGAAGQVGDGGAHGHAAAAAAAGRAGAGGDRAAPRTATTLHHPGADGDAPGDALCASCHSLIDPIGLALDNFDVTGEWRIRTTACRWTPGAQFYDGTPIDEPGGPAARRC